MGDKKKTNWTPWHNLSWAAYLIGLPMAAWYLSSNPLKVWWLFMAASVAILFITGHGITGSWKGALIDNRNVISLSRFQMTAWTILVLSAFAAATFWNIFHGGDLCLADPKQGCLPGLPETLWLLMGFSTASLVGSPLILNGKKNQQADPAEMQRTFELLGSQGYDTAGLGNQGHLVVNSEPQQARWSDLFTGEETGNFAHLDLARLQLLFFTLIALLSYGVLIGHKLGSATELIKEFPVLSEGLLALIGISHTGYLASKASQNSKSGEASNAVQPLEAGAADDEHPAVG